MILLIDAGNTRTKIGYFLNDAISRVESFGHTQDDEMKAALVGANPSRILLASVATPSAVAAIKEYALKQFVPLDHMQTEKANFGVINGYQNHTQLGVDRWLNLIATRGMFPEQNSMIVSLGTATTIDVLQSDGHHLGGWIIPGVTMMKDALISGTANIKYSTENENQSWLANSTERNVAQGSLLATQGAVLHALTQCEAKRVKIDRLVVTGGNAALINMPAPVPVMHEPNLVFKGMARYLLCK